MGAVDFSAIISLKRLALHVHGYQPSPSKHHFLGALIHTETPLSFVHTA